MSSVDRGWPPPSGARPPLAPARRRRPPTWLLALLAVLVVGALLLRPDRRSRVGGEPGLGDPYLPRAGGSGYDVERYAIDLDFDPAAAELAGTTTITARATQPLAWFYLDLALEVRSVRVDGRPATVERDGFADVRVEPERALEAGAEFRVAVVYGGRPGEVRQGDVHPWYATGQEWTVLGEPESSAWWFPANDHPSDPALLDVSVRVPTGMEAVSVGRLESRDTRDEPGSDTWHWVASQPMATYLAFLTLGQYRLEEGVEDGRPFVYAVSEQLPDAEQRTALERLRTSGATVRTLESMFGPYPFTELGGVVPAHALGFGALENQTRPVYDAEAIADPAFAPELIAHELAHMWFGNNVTLRAWDDVVNSEAWASWAQWGVAERRGGPTAAEAFERTFAAAREEAAVWSVDLTDPGADHLFDAVYTRGPLALQALRTLIGDEAFFTLARDWGQHPRHPFLRGVAGAGPGGDRRRPRPLPPGLVRGTRTPRALARARLPLASARCRCPPSCWT